MPKKTSNKIKSAVGMKNSAEPQICLQIVEQINDTRSRLTTMASEFSDMRTKIGKYDDVLCDVEDEDGFETSTFNVLRNEHSDMKDNIDGLASLIKRASVEICFGTFDFDEAARSDVDDE